MRKLELKKQTYISKTIFKLEQLLCYLRAYNPVETNRQSMIVQKKRSYQSVVKKYKSQQLIINGLIQENTNGSKILNRKQSQKQKYNNQMQLNKRIKQETIKLKMVNSFMQQIDTTLNQVMQGLELILKKVLEYQDLQGIHQNYYIKSFKQRVFSKPKYQDQRTYYHQQTIQQFEVTGKFSTEVFQNIFKHIYNCYFNENILQLVNKAPKKLAILLLEIQTKLSILPTLIDSASKFKFDITCCEPFSEKFQYAWKNIQIKKMENLAQQTRTQIQYLKKMMKITTSAVVTQKASYDVQLLKKVIFGLSFPVFWIADQQSELRCYRLWRKPKIQNLNNVWNLPQLGALKQCKKIIFPSIKTNFFIYVPTNNEHINDRISIYQNLIQKPQIFNQPQNHPQQSIRVLVLYSGRLKFKQQSKKFQPFNCFSCWDVCQEIDLQTIIIHIHGGGFVALSSQTMQSYTRIWANKLKVPIFSIDYRKPPKYRFPTALYDCFTAYKFIVQKIQKYLNIKPKKIILAGDSAGGNLAVALQGLLMQKKYPILPKGIFLAYPAVDLRMRYSPSRINSFDDPILLPPLLLLCLKQYLGQNALNQQNPLASPVLLSQYFLLTGRQTTNLIKKQLKKWPKNWPSTRIMVGKKDPLYDDSLRLLQRMSESEVDVKLIVYNQLSHAFLSMNLVITACQQAIQDSIQQIRKLIIK